MSKPPHKKIKIINSDAASSDVGGYPIKRRIGEGGAGVVYLAEDPDLKREVAIKILHGKVAQDPIHVERFKREARVMARISSPYVAAVYQVGDHLGLPYMVMEYLVGENLEWVLKRNKRIQPLAALGYLRDVCLGLEAALECEVIHRDIKPANIVVEGVRAKITDFGIAHALRGEADVTLAGQIAGTAHFMSPERIKGKKEDFRSDIYSLGATIYTLLAGHPPHHHDNPMHTLSAHLEAEPVPLKKILPDLTTDIDRLVRRMMHKKKERRFQSYEALMEEVHRILNSMGAKEMTGRFVRPPQKKHAATPPSKESDPLAQKLSGVVGKLEQMSVIEIAQLLDLGKKNATVDIHPANEKERGAFSVENGQVNNASLGALKGSEAFYALVGVREGAFQIHYDQRSNERNIEGPSTFLLIEAMRRLDQQRHDATSPQLESPTDTAQSETALPAGPFGEDTEWAPAPSALVDDSPTVEEGDLSAPKKTTPGHSGEQYVPLNPIVQSTLVPPPGAFARASDALRRRVQNEQALLSNILHSDDDEVEPTPTPVRIPYLFISALLLALIVIVFIVMRFYGGAGGQERALLDRAVNGDERALAEIRAFEPESRQADEWLGIGHALEKNQAADALVAYQRAAKGGAADEKSLAFIARRLRNEYAVSEVQLLSEWPKATVTDRMLEALDSDNAQERRHALRVLEKRGEASGINRGALMIRNLLEGETCEQRKGALLSLRKMGGGDEARGAVQKAAEREGNGCMRDEINEMLGQR